jgi:hypothetical protein
MSRTLKIVDPKDIGKLDGWTILKAEANSQGLFLIVSHPAAENDVRVKVIPIANPYMSGDVMMVARIVGVQTEDLEQKDGKPLPEKL